ncbi:MAG: hypothetical protein ACI4MP_07450 [Candidatus Ventricola sp.]
MKNRKWLPVIALVLMAAALWIGMNGRGQRVWENLQDSRLQFPEGLERSGDMYGVMNTGPALSIGGGRYTLKWDIETDADNVISITTTNRAAISPGEIVISAGQPQGSAQFTSLDEIYDLQIAVDYQAGSFIRVNRIDLVGHRNTDRLFTLTFLLLAAAALLALSAAGWLTPKRRGMLVVVALAVLIASVPDLRSNLHTGHDSEFHMGRLLNLVHGLRSGQFPVRLGAYMQNGYGAIMSVYYPELFLYFPACMILLGASFTYSYHVFFIAMHLTAALTMWYAASRMLKSEAAGCAASVLYTLSQYRLMDIYTRFGVGESLAMSVLPLFALGLYEVIWGDKRRWKLLGVSATLICQSHLISTAICGVLAAGVALPSCAHLVRDHRVKPLLKAVAAAVLLNAFFFAPLLTYSRQNVATSWMRHDLAEEAVAPAQLFLTPDRNAQIDDPELSRSAIGLGLPMIVMAGAAVYCAVIKARREKEDWLVLGLCTAGTACALMATKLFPWNRLNDMTGGMLAYIQFPWRMLMFSSLCFAFAGGYAAMRFAAEEHGGLQFAVLALCAACVLPMLSDETRKDNYLEAGALPYWDQRFGDYCLPRASLRALDVTDPIASDGVRVTDFRKFGTQIDAQVSAQKDGTIVLPLYAFDGYTAELDSMPLSMEHSEHDHMQLAVRAGMQGSLTVRFEGAGYWRFFDAVSLITAAVLVCMSLPWKKHGKA